MAKKLILQPGIYEHYKGNKYQVIGIARHSATHEELAVYREIYGEFSWWVRPLSMVLEQVEVAGKKVPRFRLIDKIKQ